ncbi:hypothetical protein C8Q80DRAFT_5577 [Daedaleopsis nitida]|nr:hypothetical protein C8Q80DRAFT_5577 [Daedaleopsis nitida]
MQIPSSSAGVAFNIYVAVVFATLSYLFNRPIRGHRLTIGRLTTSSAHDIRYEATVGNKTYTFAFNASSLTWRFCFPRSPNPRWCTITCNSIYYTSSSCDISTTRLETVLWFFPVLFRQTSGPWSDITLDGLRIKVFRSTETPYMIQRLRQNLVGTLLTGDIMRADVFRTSVKFSGLTEHQENKPTGFTDPKRKLSADHPDGHRRGEEVSEDELEDDVLVSDSDSAMIQVDEEEPAADETKPLRVYQDDEIAFSILARQLMIFRGEGRVYSFGSIDSQIRRDWTNNKGSFAMVAEECRYVHVHFPFERVAARSWWLQLFSSFFHFPIDLVRTFTYPISSTNLYVTRLDVTFESFRLRDAELLKQGFALIRENSVASQIDWSDVFLDALTHAVAPR